jgi:uncharacterized protein (UPF0548 family)
VFLPRARLAGVLVLRAPRATDLERWARSQRDEPLTYDAVGGTLSGSAAPPGYRPAQLSRTIGGAERFAEARAALREWWPQRGSGLRVWADGPVAVGTVVAMAAPLPVGFAIACCRVVAVVDEPDRYGFAYGTLPMHPESGEELFLVERTGSSVVVRIVVFSRPHEPLVRLAAPVARRLQARATSRYLDAMEAGRPSC